MFHQRSSNFDPRITAIADQLRAIENELGAIGKSAGRRASAGASAAGSQISAAIGPILSEISDLLRRGQRWAADDAPGLGNEAIKSGARLGNDALDRIASEVEQRPLITLAVALGVGFLIGIAGRRR